jgi:hypothetical protein
LNHNRAPLPDWHRDLLKHSPVDPGAYAWHWTAQVIGYVFRLNAWAISEITSKMDEAHLDHTGLKPASFDIAVHIRHGDKHYEMNLVPDQSYLLTVKLIEKLLGRKVSVFLLTDDERSVRSFEAVEGIKLSYLRCPYRHARDHGILRGYGTKAVMYALSDILIACHATWQIGTWASHVDRLILELKSVQFGKASELSLELERCCYSAAHCQSVGHSFDYLTSLWFL